MSMGLSLCRVLVKDQRRESELSEEKMAERSWREGSGGDWERSMVFSGEEDGCWVMVL